MTTMKNAVASWPAWLTVLLLGCGGGAPRDYHVTGTVTWNGQAVPRGQIFFDPDLSKQNDGVQGYALIEDGRFDTRKGRGVAGGPHVIRIAGFDGVPGNELPLGKPLFSEIRIVRDLPRVDATIEIRLPEPK